MAATVRAGKPARAPARPATRDHLPAKSNGHANGTAAPGVLRFSSSSAEPEEREPLFYIDDTEYTIPVEPSASIGLGAQDVLAEEREQLLAAGFDLKTATMTAMGLAQKFVLQEMLGQDGYEALLGYKRLRRADLKRLMEVCSERAYAAMEDEESPNR